jgi:hypothetical protein
LLGLGTKEVWELAPKIIFAFPSCFFLRVVSPLDFVELNRAPSGNTNIFLENLERSLTVSQVLVQVDGVVVDVFENIRLIRNFKTFPEQGNVEDIMIIS